MKEEILLKTDFVNCTDKELVEIATEEGLIEENDGPFSLEKLRDDFVYMQQVAQRQVLKFKFLGDYTLNITFVDGKNQNIDFLKAIDSDEFYAPLRNLEYFNQAKLVDGNIEWPPIESDGFPLDFNPEKLYFWHKD